MVVRYFGLSCFQIKHGETVLVTDPFVPRDVGISLPVQQADVVVYTQPAENVSDAARERVVVSDARKAAGKELFEIFEPGEYEIGNIFIRVLASPPVVLLTVDEVTVCYLGLCKDLSSKESFEDIGTVHYLILPVGDGGMFLDWKRVDELIEEIGPAIVIPSSYALDRMNGSYSNLRTLEVFSKEFGAVREEKKLVLQPIIMTEELQYDIVALQPSGQ